MPAASELVYMQTSHWVQRLLVCNAAKPTMAPRPPAKGDPFAHPQGRMHLRKVLSASITRLVCKRPSQNGAAPPRQGDPFETVLGVRVQSPLRLMHLRQVLGA